MVLQGLRILYVDVGNGNAQVFSPSFSVLPLDKVFIFAAIFFLM
jgi:hypothetical protein